DLAEHALDRGVVAHVELGDERARHALRELAHVLLDALALERERGARATVREPLGDRPRDRPLVGDAENQCALALEHEREPYRVSTNQPTSGAPRSISSRRSVRLFASKSARRSPSASTRVTVGSCSRAARFRSRAASGSTGANWSTTRMRPP